LLGPEGNRGHLTEHGSTGVDAGLIVGVLFPVLILVGLFVFLVLYRRRRDQGAAISMSQDGNELSFETEASTHGEFTFEDEMSGVGSQYGNLSDFDPIIEDAVADFGEGRQLEETLFTF
jgi:hypothetical protein